MIDIKVLGVIAIIGILSLGAIRSGIAPSQVQDQPPAVTQAVAPVFPPLAVAAGQDGTVDVDVQINAKGIVESAKLGTGPRILRKAVEIAATRWTFVPAEEKANLRAAHLSFVFKLLPSETPSEELLPIFRPPYCVETRTRYPKITKYADSPSKRKP
jgi:hypothetical protein